MEQTAGGIFAAVRVLVDDPEGDYATDAYLAPLLQLAQDQLVAELYANPNIGKYKTVVELPSIPQGTTSLAAYFDAGQPLATLNDIISMSEKPAGHPREQYQPMKRRTEPVTLQESDYNIYFAFDGRDVILPGATQVLDLRIFGVFDPQPIRDGESPVLPGAAVYLKFRTAAMLSRSRGQRELALDYLQQSQMALATMFNNLILEQQSIPTRQQSYSAFPWSE